VLSRIIRTIARWVSRRSTIGASYIFEEHGVDRNVLDGSGHGTNAELVLLEEVA
jgi:hypothetical protein